MTPLLAVVWTASALWNPLAAPVVVSSAFAKPPAYVVRAVRVAASTFEVDYAEMIAVSRCETVNWTDFYHGAGTRPPKRDAPAASGLFQFLYDTWQRTPFAFADRMNATANALAAAWLVRRDHGWREWACQP